MNVAFCDPVRQDGRWEREIHRLIVRVGFRPCERAPQTSLVTQLVGCLRRGADQRVQLKDISQRQIDRLDLVATPVKASCVCGDACPILLLLGDGYLPGRQVGLCARKR
jgi:hypothetical protein